MPDERERNFEVLPFWTTLFRLVSSWTFFIESLYFHEKIWWVAFWGIGVTISLIPFVKRNTTVIFEGTKRHKRFIEESHQAWIASTGIFDYAADSFRVPESEYKEPIWWRDVAAIFGYTFYGCTCWDIVSTQGHILTFSDSVEGLTQFIKRLEAHIPAAIRMSDDVWDDYDWDDIRDSNSDYANTTCIYLREGYKRIHAYYFNGEKEASINPDYYPPYYDHTYSRLPALYLTTKLQ